MSVDGFVFYQVSILSPLHQSSGQSFLLITGLESNHSPIIPKVYVRLYNCMEKFAYTVYNFFIFWTITMEKLLYFFLDIIFTCFGNWMHSTVLKDNILNYMKVCIYINFWITPQKDCTHLQFFLNIIIFI